jgi:hypothetical protein
MRQVLALDAAVTAQALVNFGRSGMRWMRAKVIAAQTVNRVASSRGLNSG